MARYLNTYSSKVLQGYAGILLQKVPITIQTRTFKDYISSSLISTQLRYYKDMPGYYCKKISITIQTRLYKDIKRPNGKII